MAKKSLLKMSGILCGRNLRQQTHLGASVKDMGVGMCAVTKMLVHQR